MESFRATLARLTSQFLSDLIAAVEADLAVPERAVVRPSTRLRIVRTTMRTEPAAAPEPNVIVSKWEIPVGRARSRTSRPRRSRAPRPPAPPREQVVKFEVVPHPERANRRMVLTRVSTM